MTDHPSVDWPRPGSRTQVLVGHTRIRQLHHLRGTRRSSVWSIGRTVTGLDLSRLPRIMITRETSQLDRAQPV